MSAIGIGGVCSVDVNMDVPVIKNSTFSIYLLVVKGEKIIVVQLWLECAAATSVVVAVWRTVGSEKRLLNYYFPTGSYRSSRHKHPTCCS